MRSYLYCVTVCILFGCGSSHQFTKAQRQLFDCKRDWKYSILKDTLTGQILVQQDIGHLCGNMAFGSNTIIRTDAGDTFRIIELCNSNKFQVGSSVKIIPDSKPSFDVIVISASFDCAVKNTSYGRAIRLKP